MDTIRVSGTIRFDVPDKTNKHKNQGTWKRVAMVLIDGDLAEYYAWFINRRYNIELNRPLRGSHVTFINDRASDMNDKWDEVKSKWDGKNINITLSVDPRTDSDDEKSKGHWWLNVPEEHRKELHDIRAELGLGRPYWGLHMALGYANNKNIEHSKYIHRLIKNGFIRYL
jgi:hypothetical protein